ncbi:Protein cbp3, mitochondrial [Tulasnella sp. 330]|nr:Protein cbp3, mitochondrial [Tulasnella sp. 330]KAG8876037.1 Protein cbp3, mitochondrial [Tulasnella sp. 331]KAG8880951.1 Protein cbp3, mitochondrial [Tulasnella sp. 332]
MISQRLSVARATHLKSLYQVLGRAVPSSIHLRNPQRAIHSSSITPAPAAVTVTTTSSTATPSVEPSSSEPAAPKPFVAPPPYKQSTPQWLIDSPTFVRSMRVVAKLLGHNSKTTTAIRETRGMYQLCAEREVKETGFLYVECKLPPTFQTWFAFTNLHVWLLTTRLRALPSPHGKLYIQELINHFFLDAEYRLRAVEGPKCPERIIKNSMIDLRNQWNGTTISYDVALMKGDVELASAVWRNVFAGRGEKAYKEKDLAEEEKAKLVEARKKDNDPEAFVGALGSREDVKALEELPGLVVMYVAHVRRELKRLEGVSDELILDGEMGRFGRVGSLGDPEMKALDEEGVKLVQQLGGELERGNLTSTSAPIS